MTLYPHPKRPDRNPPRSGNHFVVSVKEKTWLICNEFFDSRTLDKSVRVLEPHLLEPYISVLVAPALSKTPELMRKFVERVVGELVPGGGVN